MIKIIVAYDKNKLIGNGDKLVWNIKQELNHFKNTTLNQTILMGDKTFDGIGFPLPNRKTIILTKDLNYDYEHENVSVINDFKKIVNKYQKNPNKHIFICGGSQIYALFLPYADELYISEIKGEYIGDKFFADWNENEFDLLETVDYEEFTFKHFKRKL